MKTKEKIERSGFVYKANYGSLEIYVKGDIALLYEPAKDEAYAYIVFGSPQLHLLDDIQFEILLTK